MQNDTKKLACEILRLQNRYSRILEHSFEEIYVFSDKTLLFTEVSQGTLQNIGYSLEEMKTLSAPDIKPLVSASEFNKLIQPLRDGTEQILTFETIHERKDGSTYDVSIRLQYVDEIEPVFIAMVTDISERNAYEQELKNLAFKDPGTDLYNKRFFQEQLEVTISNVNRRMSTIGLILIDLDDFSIVNNEYGHVAGDAILKGMAHKIEKVFSRRTDIVARYGGDEFIVICEDGQRDALVNKCNQLLALFNEPVIYEGKEIHQTASIGLCLLSGEDGFVSSKDLVKRADKAMYEAKSEGKNSFRICET